MGDPNVGKQSTELSYDHARMDTLQTTMSRIVERFVARAVPSG
jgi:hypothetical protein